MWPTTTRECERYSVVYVERNPPAPSASLAINSISRESITRSTTNRQNRKRTEPKRKRGRYPMPYDAGRRRRSRAAIMPAF